MHRTLEYMQTFNRNKRKLELLVQPCQIIYIEDFSHTKNVYFYLRLPDEVFSVPPPPLLNHGSVWGAFMYWVGTLEENAINQRPVLGSGVHRQLLWISVGFYLGHYLVRRANYTNAKRGRDMFEYIRHHPEDFKETDKKTTGEVLEDFHPVR